MASVVQPGRQTGTGDELPPLWHWAYFPELGPTEALGRDGHLRRGDAWADRFPRRVAAGGRVTRQAPFVIGVPAERRSQLVGARERVGHSGPLVLCDWRHTYHQADEMVLEEIQTLVYRPHRPSGVEGGDAPAPAASEGDERLWDRAGIWSSGPSACSAFRPSRGTHTGSITTVPTPLLRRAMAACSCPGRCWPYTSPKRPSGSSVSLMPSSSALKRLFWAPTKSTSSSSGQAHAHAGRRPAGPTERWRRRSRLPAMGHNAND